MKVLTLLLVFFTGSGFPNSFNLSTRLLLPIFSTSVKPFLDTISCKLVTPGYDFWFSLSLSACLNLQAGASLTEEAGLRTDGNGLQDVSPFVEENGSENMKKPEEELMMHRSDKGLSLKTVSEKNSSKQMIQDQVTLASKMEDVLEEHLGRSEEDSKFNKNTPTAKMVHFTPKSSTVLLSGKPTIVTQMENNAIFMVGYNKVSPPQPQGTKPSPRLKRLPTTAPSTSPTETSRISRNEEPSKDKRRRKDSKTQKPQEGKNKIPPPTLFPHFMDDYCPPMCACYGRVVQCSNKGVEDFPYGIPYNAHYILLMNNHISSIQLDLLSEYSSMKFLSLRKKSGIPVLKRPLSGQESTSKSYDWTTISWRRCLRRPGHTTTAWGIDLDLFLLETTLSNLTEGFFNGISQMLVLDLSANRLKSKGLLRDSLINATHLESLNLEGNKLKEVPRNLPNSLKTLNLEGNLISSIKKASFRNLDNLEHLGLARNEIFKVSAGAFKALHRLDLCHNKLHQVPRRLPEGLHSVALAYNKIDLTLSRLVQVRLEHNMGKLDVRAFRCLRGTQVVHFH
uniref:LRRNT domain-containing protein n=1 Tax=Poecilia mexicana TaxID=48701 RepID=A0A3B3YM88_9TELE